MEHRFTKTEDGGPIDVISPRQARSRIIRLESMKFTAIITLGFIREGLATIALLF